MFTSNSASLNDMNGFDDFKREISNLCPGIFIKSVNIDQANYSFLINCIQFDDPISIEYISKSNDEILEEFKEKVDIWTLMGLRKEINILPYTTNMSLEEVVDKIRRYRNHY